MARCGSTLWLYGDCAVAIGRTFWACLRFEPVVSTAGCVAQTRGLNGLRQATVVPCGLGAPESVAYLKLPLERGMADQTLSGDAERWWEPIQIARLDWLWPLLNSGIDAIDGVKIDVQGMEIEVLRGMEDVLRRQHPKLVVELHAGVDRSTVLDLLARAGYQTKGCAIEPQSNEEFKDNRSYVFVAKDAKAL